MSVLSDILKAWAAVASKKRLNHEKIATLLEFASDEAASIVSVYGQIDECDGYEAQQSLLERSKINGSCAALKMIYEQASSVVMARGELDSLLFRLGDIMITPLDINIVLRGDDPLRRMFIYGADGHKIYSLGIGEDGKGSLKSLVIKLSQQAGELRAFAKLYRAKHCQD